MISPLIEKSSFMAFLFRAISWSVLQERRLLFEGRYMKLKLCETGVYVLARSERYSAYDGR